MAAHPDPRGRAVRVSAVVHLRDEGREVGNLPRLGDLALAEVGDHRLIDPERAACALHASKGQRERAGHNDPSHLHVTVDQHLLNVMPQIGHGG